MMIVQFHPWATGGNGLTTDQLIKSPINSTLHDISVNFVAKISSQEEETHM